MSSPQNLVLGERMTFFNWEARKRDVDHWAHARNGSGDQGCREAADATDPP